MPSAPPRRHSYHDRSSNNNPVFTDYAPGSAHARTSQQKDKDLLILDAAFTWCHKQIEGTAMSRPKSKMKTKELPNRPVLITSNVCLAEKTSKGRVQVLPLCGSTDDHSTPSTLSASSSSSEADTYAYSVATNSLQEEEEDRSFDDNSYIDSSVPTLKRKTSKTMLTSQEQLAQHCGRFCVTTEAMLQRMLYQDVEQMQRSELLREQERRKQRGLPPLKVMEKPKQYSIKQQVDTMEEEDTTTSDESFDTSSCSASSGCSEESSVVRGEVIQYYNPNQQQQQQQQNNHERNLKARFSNLWKKNIRDRRHRATEEVEQEPEEEEEHPSPLLHGVVNKSSPSKQEKRFNEREEKRASTIKTDNQEKRASVKSEEQSPTDIEVKLMGIKRDEPKFRPIMTLRKLRQQKLVQERQLRMQFDRSLKLAESEDSFVKENKISVTVQEEEDAEEENMGYDLPSNLTSARKTCEVPRSTSTQPFEESDNDEEREIDRRSSRLKRLMEYNRRKLEEKKPFDEESTSVDLVDHNHNIKIVGKWKEEGDGDSDFFSIADTPYMKRADVYKPKETLPESDAEDSQLSEHLEFMKGRTSPIVPIPKKLIVQKPKSILKTEDLFNPQKSERKSKLERKLGKKMKPRFVGVASESVSTTTPCVESSAFSCTSSCNAPSTNAVFLPRHLDEDEDLGNDAFLKGDESDVGSLGSLFATDISAQEQNKKYNFQLD